MLVAGLAEMNLGVDDARQHGQIGGVDDLSRGAGIEGAEPRDAPVADRDVDIGGPAGGPHGAALHNKIVGLAHAVIRACLAGPMCQVRAGNG